VLARGQLQPFRAVRESPGTVGGVGPLRKRTPGCANPRVFVGAMGAVAQLPAQASCLLRQLIQYWMFHGPAAALGTNAVLLCIERRMKLLSKKKPVPGESDWAVSGGFGLLCLCGLRPP
jgi:hypothetical protein